MSYQMRTDERSRKAGRFVSRVHKAIQKAVVRSGLKQNDIATKLGLDRSIVNRRILGQSNLTLRTIADFAWALDHDIEFDLVPRKTGKDVNRPAPEATPSGITVTAATSNISSSAPQPVVRTASGSRRVLEHAS